ncbi:hypothetical protein CRYUN_Cryun32bG0021100 [Craigia yunnanensis]
MKESGIEIEAMQSHGGSTSLKSKICAEEVDECILWLSILFITILCAPQPTIVRWSSTPSVSDDVLHQWKGFCALIANAYYIRGMAWFKIMLVLSFCMNPLYDLLIADWLQWLVQVISPQWPRV